MSDPKDAGSVFRKIASSITRDLDQGAARIMATQTSVQRDLESVRNLAKVTPDLLKHAEVVRKSLRQVAEPLRKQLDPLAYGTRNHNQAIAQAIRALDLDFEAIARAMDEDRARFPEETRTLAQYGWYAQPSMTTRQLRELCTALKSSDACKVEEALIVSFNKGLDAIEEKLCGNSPSRGRMLRSAFAAHRRRDFAASIPLMLAQADGLCRDYTKNHLFSRPNGLKKWIKAGKPWPLECFVALVEPSPLTAAEHDRAGKVALFNRHAIMHGESVDYDTPANGARAVSLLVYIDWILSEVSPSNRSHEASK